MKIKYILMISLLNVEKNSFCSDNSFSDSRMRRPSSNENKTTIRKRILKKMNTEPYEETERESTFSTTENPQVVDQSTTRVVKSYQKRSQSPTKNTEYSEESDDSESDILAPKYPTAASQSPAPQKLGHQQGYQRPLKKQPGNNSEIDKMPEQQAYSYGNKIFQNRLRRRSEEKGTTMSYNVPDSTQIITNQHSPASQFTSINLFEASEKASSFYPSDFVRPLDISFSNPKKKKEEKGKDPKKVLTIIEAENGKKEEIEVIQTGIGGTKIYKKIVNGAHFAKRGNTALKKFYISEQKALNKKNTEKEEGKK